jgi:pSer/pThr/pTyr-binding forkhead associated (FHA) protein
MLKLVCTTDPDEAYCLFRSSVATVGRASGKHVLIQRPAVSRNHAEVRVCSDGTVSVCDLKSASGTVLVDDDGRVRRRLPPREPVVVKPNEDLIVFGDPQVRWTVESRKLQVLIKNVGRAEKEEVTKVSSWKNKSIFYIFTKSFCHRL